MSTVSEPPWNTDSETMAMAAEVVGIESADVYCVSKTFNENAQLSFGHTAPFTIVEGNSVDALRDQLNLISEFYQNLLTTSKSLY